MKERILILEDSLERHRQFREKFGLHVVIVDTTSEAIKLLAEKRWDILFLDHDLGDEGNVPSGPGTGYEVACWLEEHQSHMPKKVVLHSSNQPGRNKMKAALPDAIHAPNAWTKGVIVRGVWPK
jgi:DNA-binding response OmpR family regulator